jgi:hypothetical protein
LTDLSFISNLSLDLIPDFARDRSPAIEPNLVIDMGYDIEVNPVINLFSTPQPDLVRDIQTD